MHVPTLAALEFGRIREELASHAACQLGKELAMILEPMTATAAIRQAQADTTEAKGVVRRGKSIPFGGIQDVRLYLRRVDQGGVLKPDQLNAVADTLYGCRQLKEFLIEQKELAPNLALRAAHFGQFGELEEAIRTAIELGQVSSRASHELKQVRKELGIIEGRIQDRLQGLLKQYRSHLQESLVTTRDGHYVLPVKATSRSQVPGAVRGASASGVTLFIEPEAIRQLCNDLEYWKALEQAEEEKVLMALSGQVALHADALQATLIVVAELDFTFAKGRLSYAWDAGPVEWNQDGVIDLQGARHPLLGRDAVGNRITLARSTRLLVVTGPNTGGKTLLLKTLGLLILAAQSGLHIPVDSGSTLCRFKSLFADIGDSQSLEQSLSTFSGHIANVAPMLTAAGPDTLVLLDELGAGTDPHEGTGLGIALLEAFLAKGSYVLATTHLREIKEFGRVTDGCAIAGMGFDSDTLRPTYRLVYGTLGESHGLLIAARAGLAPAVVERAHQLLHGTTASYDAAAAAGARDRTERSEHRRAAVPEPISPVADDEPMIELEEIHTTDVAQDWPMVVGAVLGRSRVLVNGEVQEFTLKGSLRREYPSGPVVGDRVQVVGEQVVAVAKRQTYLARRQAGTKGGEQVIAANLTRMLIVLAARQPEFRPAVLDRHLVYAAQYGITPIICITKADLVRPGVWQEWLKPYEDMGYHVAVTSVEQGFGLERLREMLRGQVSAVLGHSGVGKSSLLGALTGANLATGDVRERGARTGKHTTTSAEAIRLDDESWVIDTPGLRELGFWKLTLPDLQTAFREFDGYAGLCRFRGCTHVHEPGCGVQLAVKQGQVDRRRYDQYVKLAAEAK